MDVHDSMFFHRGVVCGFRARNFQVRQHAQRMGKDCIYFSKALLFHRIRENIVIEHQVISPKKYRLQREVPFDYWLGVSPPSWHSINLWEAITLFSEHDWGFPVPLLI